MVGGGGGGDSGQQKLNKSGQALRGQEVSRWKGYGTCGVTGRKSPVEAHHFLGLPGESDRSQLPLEHSL